MKNNKTKDGWDSPFVRKIFDATIGGLLAIMCVAIFILSSNPAHAGVLAYKASVPAEWSSSSQEKLAKPLYEKIKGKGYKCGSITKIAKHPTYGPPGLNVTCDSSYKYWVIYDTVLIK